MTAATCGPPRCELEGGVLGCAPLPLLPAHCVGSDVVMIQQLILGTSLPSHTGTDTDKTSLGVLTREGILCGQHTVEWTLCHHEYNIKHQTGPSAAGASLSSLNHDC